jgi:hypothetical protein
VPNERNARLGIAEKDLEGKGIPYKVLVRGGASGAALSSWRVCETQPSPRFHLESGTTVRLIVAPSCS